MPWDPDLTSEDRRLLRENGLRRVYVSPKEVEPAVAAAKFSRTVLCADDIASDPDDLVRYVKKKLQYARTMKLLADDDANWHGVMMLIWHGLPHEVKQNLPAPSHSVTLHSYLRCMDWARPQILHSIAKADARRAREADARRAREAAQPPRRHKSRRARDQPNESRGVETITNNLSDLRIYNDRRQYTSQPQQTRVDVRENSYNLQYGPNNLSYGEQRTDRSTEHQMQPYDNGSWRGPTPKSAPPLRDGQSSGGSSYDEDSESLESDGESDLLYEEDAGHEADHHPDHGYQPDHLPDELDHRDDYGSGHQDFYEPSHHEDYEPDHQDDHVDFDGGDDYDGGYDDYDDGYDDYDGGYGSDY
ncbi:hypothetical protein GGR52DRAFT_462626 [Hypoxylon sp. FL1284]|nr:hypothetical protein GGR52DRAFT_462626 [Hypoxylon sp. FL1284]